MRRIVLRLVHDERGQDLIEYALLTSFIAFAGLAVMDVLLNAINNTYGSQETAVNSLWEPPAPSTGS
jgi:Flp pilus assembly pilin Flp